MSEARSAATPSREPTTAEIAETLLDYSECLAWAEQFKGTPFNMLPLATVAAQAAGPLLVMRSLFALAARVEKLEAENERLRSEREPGPMPHKCANPECGTIEYGVGYAACPGCGGEEGRADA